MARFCPSSRLSLAGGERRRRGGPFTRRETATAWRGMAGRIFRDLGRGWARAARRDGVMASGASSRRGLRVGPRAAAGVTLERECYRPRMWFQRGARIERKVDALLSDIKKLGEKLMGQLEDLTTAIDAETNAISARVDKLTADLQAALANGQPPNPATLAQLAAISGRLKVLGADPANPVPPPAPAPTP